MNVAELIERLQALPQDAPVQMLWDGACRGDVKAVWLCRGGHVALSWPGEPVYSDDDRTIEAPTEAENRYLYVHEMLGIPEDENEDDLL